MNISENVEKVGFKNIYNQFQLKFTDICRGPVSESESGVLTFLL
jgi:hypothetical protein